MKSVEMASFVKIAGMLLYFFIAAQGAFYHFGFGKALYNIPVENFITLRKAVDPVVRDRFKVLYLAAIGLMFVWLLLTDKSNGFWSYAPVLLSFLFLLADMLLILKFSEPVNQLINSDALNGQENFREVRAQWLRFIFLRGYLSVAGFALLLIQLIFNQE